MPFNIKSVLWQTARGVLILSLLHAIVWIFLIIVAFALGYTRGELTGIFMLWACAVYFPYWQLLYVVPLILFWWLKKRRAAVAIGIFLCAVFFAFLLWSVYQYEYVVPFRGSEAQFMHDTCTTVASLTPHRLG